MREQLAEVEGQLHAQTQVVEDTKAAMGRQRSHSSLLEAQRQESAAQLTQRCARPHSPFLSFCKCKPRHPLRLSGTTSEDYRC